MDAEEMALELYSYNLKGYKAAVAMLEQTGRARSNAYIEETGAVDVGMDIFRRGLCLPSDNKMTKAEQNGVIEIIHRCFE